MPGTCCVPTCSNSPRKNKQFSYHRFPTDEKLRSTWISNVQAAIGLPSWTPTKHSFICGAHFSSTEGKKRKWHSPPVLFHNDCLLSNNSTSDSVPRLQNDSISRNASSSGAEAFSQNQDNGREEAAAFLCTQCSYGFHWQFQLDNHKKKSHFFKHSNVPLFACDKQTVKQHKCELCLFKTDCKTDLHEHFRVVHLGLPKQRKPPLFLCRYCSFTTTSLFVGTQHVSKDEHHEEETTAVTVPYAKWFICTECSYRSKGRQDLQHHLANDCIRMHQCHKCSFKVVIKKRSTGGRSSMDKHFAWHRKMETLLNSTRGSSRASSNALFRDVKADSSNRNSIEVSGSNIFGFI